MPDRYWPLFELRIETPELTLRPMTEPDLETLADLLPDDVDMDPAATRFEGADHRTQRGTIVHQSYWKAMGTWSVAAWRLNFVVLADDKIVGVQELEANDFLTLRTVDSASFLVAQSRGRGWGQQMRRAVLALAFQELGALAAITSAYQDNHASLGVSRALGYMPNGESLLARGDGVDTLVHMRMTAAQFDENHVRQDVAIANFDACRPYFGLTVARGNAQ